DRVALALPTGAPFLRALFGAQLVGAIPVAVNPTLPPEAIARRLSRVAADLVVADDPRAPGLSARLGALGSAGLTLIAPAPALPTPAPRPGDLAYLQLTSGTTGESQAAAITHASLLASLEASRRLVGATPADVL